jgi:TPR repeat protein
MFRTIGLLVLLSLLAGCGDNGRDAALKLEKRVLDGDAEALNELDRLSKDNPFAALAAGRAYQLGNAGKADLGEAMYHYELAKKLPAAWHNAGNLYLVYLYDGALPSKDGSEPENACFSASAKSAAMKAIDCLKISAKDGGMSASALTLGNIFSSGLQDVRVDRVVACAWYRIAANEHHPAARFKYGECLDAKVPGESDTRDAFHFYVEAAKSGYVPAIEKLVSISLAGGSLEQQAFWLTLLSRSSSSNKHRAASQLARIPSKIRIYALQDVEAWEVTHHPSPTQEFDQAPLPMTLEKGVQYKF